MEKYFKRVPNQPSPSQNASSGEVPSSSKRKATSDQPSPSEIVNPKKIQCSSEMPLLDVDFDNLPSDPALRVQISDYHPNIRDQVRRAYLLKGPCQPLKHDFPQTIISGEKRRFKPHWFDEGGGWLEYSIMKDAAFCFHCYLFRPSGLQGGSDSFTVDGFRNWKQKKKKFDLHVGGPNSAHNQAYRRAQDLINQKQHIETILCKQSEQARSEYRIRLKASVYCIRFLLRQGLAFRGHDESGESTNQGNFRELLRYTADLNEDIKSVVLSNAPENLQLVSPEIQRDIANACAVETTNLILKDLDGSLFALLVDESRDISIKEQMAVVIRYVDRLGRVIERFIGVVHVKETSAVTLKAGVEALFAKNGLSITSLRGQGYDGASNMQGKFNGLQALIMRENESAFFVHCFAHQLQLALVGVAKSRPEVSTFFNIVSSVQNIVAGSCKRLDLLRENQATKILEGLDNGELQSGKGLNQKTNLKRPGETRWGSHYGSLMNLILMFAAVVDMLEDIQENGSNGEQRGEALGILKNIHSFDFILCLHMMKSVLGITNDLSRALQRQDQDIVNAMGLVKIAKDRLQKTRDDGWDPLLNAVSLFCVKVNVIVPEMDDIYAPFGRPRRGVDTTNLHHYRSQVFYKCIDEQGQELRSRFNEVNTELLLCVACLNPSDSFSSFDKIKLLRLAELYPSDFSAVDRMALDDQLENYIYDMRSREDFLGLNGISNLARKMVKTKKHISYPLVYLLMTLALTLPVATASVERAFSAMRIVKGRLRNKMGDEWLNDSLVTYIENELFNSIDDETIMQRFQSMRSRRGQL